MRIVIAPDSFKESLTAVEAAAAMAAGVAEVWPDAEVTQIPLADGGEGTIAALASALNGEIVPVPTVDALGRPITASFAWIADKRIAVVEVAAAIGLEHVAAADRDILAASTVGLGEVLRAVAARAPRQVIVGLGGTATNDGGWGMAWALGARLYDGAGKELAPTSLALREAVRLDTSGMLAGVGAGPGTGLGSGLEHAEILLATDVDNPLLGEFGATYTFGPQKGANPGQLADLETALTVWGGILDACGASVSGKDCAAYEDRAGGAGAGAGGTSVGNGLLPSLIPGAGAGGGLGAAFLALFGARQRSGAEVVIEAAGLDAAVAGADLVLTGEGGMDRQTRYGKTPWAVLQTARRHGVPTIAFAGRLGEGAAELLEDGFAATVPILPAVCDLSEALASGKANLQTAVANACRLIELGRVKR